MAYVDTSLNVRFALRAPDYGTQRDPALVGQGRWGDDPVRIAEAELVAVRRELAVAEQAALTVLLEDYVCGVRSQLRARQRARLRNPAASAQLASDVSVSVDELWDRMDIDGDGSVSIDEIAKLSKVLGAKVKKKDLKAMFAEVDTDGSGEIDKDEFAVWWGQCQQRASAMTPKPVPAAAEISKLDEEELTALCKSLAVSVLPQAIGEGAPNQVGCRGANAAAACTLL